MVHASRKSWRLMFMTVLRTRLGTEAARDGDLSKMRNERTVQGRASGDRSSQEGIHGCREGTTHRYLQSDSTSLAPRIFFSTDSPSFFFFRSSSADPRLAALQLSNLISALTTSLSPSPALAPSAYPLYSALQLLLTVQLHAHQFEAALATSSIALRGARALFPSGHPVLALLMTTHARLLTTPPASDPAHPEREMQYWMTTDRRMADVHALVAALKQVELAFGDGSQGEGVRPGMKGGEMAAMLRILIRDQEEGIEMGRRMRMAAEQQQQA